MAKTRAVSKHPGIYSYETKQGRRYAVSTTVGGRQRWAQGYRTITEAEEAKVELRTKGNAPAKLTMKDYLYGKWLPSLSLSPATMRVYRIDVDRIVRHIGDVKLQRLEPLDVETFKEGMRKDGLAPRSQNHSYLRLSQALKQARRWRLIRHNPCEDVDPPRFARYQPQLVQLTTQDIIQNLDSLFSAAEEEGHGLMIYLTALTGMREGEVFGLEWAHVDFATGWLYIPRGNTKTDAGARDVLLDDGLLERLRTHRHEQLQRWKRALPHVFVNSNGNRWEQRAFWRHWRKIRDRAGMPEMHFHDLRHVQGTLLARAGVHPKVMQQRLGHADVSTTLRIYTHANREEQRGAVEGLVQMFRKPEDMPA